jgi:hypothetical protein
MKAWIINCSDEWITLVHADIAGKAKAIVFRKFDYEYIDFTARRMPQLDNKPFTHQDCLAADFEYLDDWHGTPIKPEEFINDCPCEVCNENQKIDAKNN